MKVRERDGKLVVSQRKLWPAAVAVLALAAALAFGTLLQARLSLACEVEDGERRCLVADHSLLGDRSSAVIAAAEVQRIEVVNLHPEKDAATYCVVIVTASASHEVDRCSARREPRLDELVGEIRAFFAGERQAVDRVFEHKGAAALPVVLFGAIGLLMLLAPTVWRADFDRSRGVVVVRGGSWFRRRTRRVPLDDVAGVSIVQWENDHGEQRRLRLDLVDGRAVELGDDTGVDLEPSRQAVERYLASSRGGYR